MLHLPDKDVRLKPGYMYIIPAFVIHSYECHGVFKLYYIHMYEGFKNEVDMQETLELPTEVWAGNSVKRLFEYVSTQHPDAMLPGPDPKSYDTSAQTSDYVKRYMNMALWEKMELRGAMLMIMSHFIREAKPRIWTWPMWQPSPRPTSSGFSSRNLPRHLFSTSTVKRWNAPNCCSSPLIVR